MKKKYLHKTWLFKKNILFAVINFVYSTVYLSRIKMRIYDLERVN